MSGWRYFAQRLHGDGTASMIHSALPLADVELTNVLSGPDRLVGNISPEFSALRDQHGIPLLQPWSTAIFAEQDDIIRLGGILAVSDFDGPSWRLDCVGFSGYAKDMPWVGEPMPAEQGVGADPMDLFRTIWAHLQGQPGGNLGLVVDQGLSGMKIGTRLEQVEFDTQSGPVSFEAGPYKLDEWSAHDLGQKLDELASLTQAGSSQRAFDYDEEHVWGPQGTVEHRLRLYHPEKGTRRHDLRFVVGENVRIIPQIEQNGEDYANEVLFLGAGEGRDMVRGTSVRPPTRLRRVAVVADKSVRSAQVATDLARQEVQYRTGEGVVSTVVVTDWLKTGASIGDEIRVMGNTHSSEIDQWGRVSEVSYSPDTDDSATVTLIPARVAA